MAVAASVRPHEELRPEPDRDGMPAPVAGICERLSVHGAMGRRASLIEHAVEGVMAQAFATVAKRFGEVALAVEQPALDCASGHTERSGERLQVELLGAGLDPLERIDVGSERDLRLVFGQRVDGGETPSKRDD